MKNVITRVDKYRLATLTALTVSLLLILSAIYLPQEVSAYKARFMCNGRIHTACNELNGESISKDPDTSNPEHWCKTFQIDDNNPPEWSYKMVYIGDNGEKCTHYGGKPNTCDPDDLDWDCSRPPKPAEPTNKPPTCDGLSVDKTVVKTLNEQITITVKGSDKEGNDNRPSQLLLYAAVGGQINKNPGDLVCSFANVADPNYSYYCQAERSWKIFGSNKNSKSLTVKTNFLTLKKQIEQNAAPFNGKVEKNGIYVVANVVGQFREDICSSNIARNNGNGVYYNGGDWAKTCQGGCYTFIKYQPPAKPQEPVSCNGSCETTNDCAGDLVCSNGSCRNYSCTAETDCTCPAQPAEPRCGDNVCNQTSEMCENGVSCSSGAAVSCRTDCTYCGDGVKNGDEQCDWAQSGVANCTAQCTTVHTPVDTAGFGGWIDENMALVVGFGMLFTGAGVVALAVPLKRKIRIVY